MEHREGYVERESKETIVKCYWNLDDIRKPERKSTNLYGKKIDLPEPMIGFKINDKTLCGLVNILDEKIQSGKLSRYTENSMKKIFGEYFWTLHLKHWLDQIAKHGKYDFRIYAESLDGSAHHLYEDIYITAGQTLSNALGEKRGIKRFGNGHGSFEGVVADVTVDISGRGSCSLFTQIKDRNLEEMVQHLYSFANSAQITLNASVDVLDRKMENEHHKAESIFKGLALALNEATKIDEMNHSQVPSTKELID